VSVDLKQI